MRKGMRVFLLVLLMVCLCGCGIVQEEKNELWDKAGKEPTYRVGIVLKAMDSEYCLALRSGIVAAAEQAGIEPIIVHPVQETETEKQRMMIHDMIASDIDALVVMPCDSYYTSDYVQKARKQNIPVFAMDTDIYDEDVIYIGSDNWQIGVMAAKEMSELLQGKGTVAVLAGTLTQAPHIERLGGFKTYIAEHTEIEVVYEEQAYCSFVEAVDRAGEIFHQFPNIDGVFSTNGTMALGVVERMTFLELEREIPIIGVDTQSDCINKVLDGKIAGMVSQDAYDIAYATINAVHRYLDGEDVESNIYTDSQFIIKKNALKYINLEPAWLTKGDWE